jgi:predicted transcriptional regulator of viral defense system
MYLHTVPRKCELVASLCSYETPRRFITSQPRAAKGLVSVDIVSQELGIERLAAAKLLSRWQQQDWLRRIGHGLYVPVPLYLVGSEQLIADPWVLVPTLFNQWSLKLGLTISRPQPMY